MQTLQINSTLQSGKYTIKKVLGQGGFGITYLAEHNLLGTKVAIKEFFMKELNSRDESTSQVSVGAEGSRELVMKFRDKFIKEARNIARLNHPNIIRIHDIFEENGTAYYVMEYCEGESLNELLKMHPSGLGEAMSVKYIRQVASALQYIHERKMNHLDVKPANIMLNAGNAVLIDFGMSKQYDSTGSQTSTTPVGISHGFAPLEQYKQGGVSEFSPATDIYSLGATLYKLITGQTPPDAQTLIDEDLPTINATASVAIAIRQAMQVKRSNRPQSIAAWLQLLDSSAESSIDDESTQVFQSAWQEEEERRRRAQAEKERKEKERLSREAEKRRIAEEEQLAKMHNEQDKHTNKTSSCAKFMIIPILIIGIIISLFKCGGTNSFDPSSNAEILSTDLDSLAYSYGVLFGNNYSNFQDKDSVLPGVSLDINDFLAGFIPAIERSNTMPMSVNEASDYLERFQKRVKEVQKDDSYQARIEDFPGFEFSRLAIAYGTVFGDQYSNFQDSNVVVPDEIMSLELFLDGFVPAIHRDYENLKIQVDDAQQFLQDFQNHLQEKIQQKREHELAYNKTKGAEFMSKNAEKAGIIVTESGLQVEIQREGYGKQPKAGNKVLINYKGFLIDGTQFDANENIEFNVNNVVSGFKEGLMLMKEGGKAILTMSSDLAYGDRGAGANIPGGSTLIFEVELLKVSR